MMTDPIADMLTRIRNAGTARHAQVTCPLSKQKLAIAGVLQQAGFLDSVDVQERDGHRMLVVGIRYDDGGRPLIDGIQRVSRPGRRVYVDKGSVPRVRNGLGVAVLSTSRGIVSDREAREQNLGGELVCEVW
jgi:small subunit ribosomal protein S8